MAVVAGRTLFVAMAAGLMLAACAPRMPAPVEDRTRDPGSREPVRVVVPPIYRVERGDTLYAIAFRFGLDWRELARWNAIQAPYTIRPGQELRLHEPPESRTRGRAGETGRRIAREAPEDDNAAGTQTAETESADPAPGEGAPEQEQADTPVTGGPRRTVAGIEWQWPADGRVLRAFDAAATRRGLRIGGEAGSAVRAAAAGSVVYSGRALIGYGELIIIKHSDTLLSAYGHNRERLVDEGQWVGIGQQIAEMGLDESGEAGLHFEIRRDGQPVNPVDYLPAR